MSSDSNDKKTLLVVDDDLANRLILCSLLRESGYISIEAKNGQEAVQAVKDNHIDVVLFGLNINGAKEEESQRGSSVGLLFAYLQEEKRPHLWLVGVLSGFRFCAASGLYKPFVQ